MRRYNPLVAQTDKRFNPLLARGQVYDTLELPAAGVLVWTALGHIVAIYRVTTDFGHFALVSWPDTALPLFVRDQNQRYCLNDADPSIYVYSLPYTGQLLTAAAIFEVWNAGDSPVTFPAYSIVISPRTQICCGDEAVGAEHATSLYLPACETFPICLPICSAT